MTISGTAAPMGRAADVRIPNIKLIEARAGKIIATDAGGQTFTLRLDNPF